jgi:hypothetical protein
MKWELRDFFGGGLFEVMRLVEGLRTPGEFGE